MRPALSEAEGPAFGPKLVAVCALLACAGLPARAEEGGGEVAPPSWLNWLMQVRIAGRTVISSPAAMALAWSLVAAAVVVAVSVIATRRAAVRPGKLQLALEMVVGTLRGLVVTIIGPRGVDFVPFIGTLFVYIAAMNLLGLVPGFLPGTSNLSITAALAIVVFVTVQYYGFRENGIGYLKHFVEGVPSHPAYFPLMVLVFVVHVISELIRPVTLALRLFVNIMAGEAVVLVLIGLMVPVLMRHWIPIPVQLPNLVLEVLIAIVQAMVFSLLAAVYLAGVVRQEEAH
jgi:F-type H+-transporting ATPase subunit a